MQKKKLSNKLGSQWNKEELERFYEAYRKYGKDWKKVCLLFAVFLFRHLRSSIGNLSTDVLVLLDSYCYHRC